MATKSILSVLALAGNKAAAVDMAARDLHTAIFHLCHAGQATPLNDTFAALPNRGKSAKIRAVVSDYWQAAALYRAAVKADGKLDKSGRYVGLQADNIPFGIADITESLSEAVATVKKEKAEKPEAVAPTAPANTDDTASGSVSETATLQNDLEIVQAELDQARALVESQRLELIAAYEKITKLESAIESAGFDIFEEALAA